MTIDFATPSKRKSSHPVAIGVFVAVSSAATIIPQVNGSALTLVAVFLAPVTLRLVRQRAPQAFLGATLWGASVVLSGLVHGSEVPSLIANLFYPLATLTLAGIFLLLERSALISARALVASAAVGLIAGSVLSGAFSQAQISPLKLGLGLGIGVLTLATVGATRELFWSTLLLVAVSSLFILFDFRSMGAMLFVAAIARFALITRTSRTVRAAVVRSCVIVAVSVGAILGLSTSISAGFFGAEAQARFASQSDSQAGLLQAARPETVVSTIALRDSWFMGRGYSQPLSGSEASEAVGMYALLGMPLNSVQEERIIGTGINSHSLLLTTWISTGLLGALGVSLIAWQVVRGALAALRSPTRLAPLTIFAAMLVTWDTLFSPWNPRNEVWLGVAVLLASVAVSSRKTFGFASQGDGRDA